MLMGPCSPEADSCLSDSQPIARGVKGRLASLAWSQRRIRLSGGAFCPTLRQCNIEAHPEPQGPERIGRGRERHMAARSKAESGVKPPRVREDQSASKVVPISGEVAKPRRRPAARSRTSTRSARSRRSAMCRSRCTPGRSARSGTVRPRSAMQIEVLPTWELDSHDVLVLVMAAGVNYNGVWASLGTPISPHRRAQEPLSRRRLRCVRHRLRRRLQGEALEGRRRGRHPLQPGRRRRRGVQRRRPDVLALPAHLGLRDAGRLVRAVLPRAGPPADGAAQAPHLGGERLLHPGAGHRLPHAVRPPPARHPARARTCWCGAPRAGSARWRCS